MKLLVTALNMFLLFISVAAQDSAPAETIEWNEFYKLKWTDFSGSPGENAAGDAGSVVQIKAKPFVVKDRVEYDVRTLFNRQKSWKRDQSSALLAHEQLHFDLAELYARKIRQRIAQIKEAGVKDVSVYNKEIQKILNESNDADMQYDIETLHGALDKKQEAWAASVQSELTALAKFKKPRRVLGRS